MRRFILIAALALGNLHGWSQTAVVELELSDDVSPSLPPVGAHKLRIISPTLLEVSLINTKPPEPAPVDLWNFVDANVQLHLPALESGQWIVQADEQLIPVKSAGFKRRPLYAPLQKRDLRIANYLYLRLASPIAEGQRVQVQYPSATLWPTNWQFQATADPLRFSPAIHVNQVGYRSTFPKTAIVGYYLGNLGELNVPSAAGFKLIDHKTSAVVFEGPLVQRADAGYTYGPRPYQNVWEADFTNFTTPGEYRVLVPGLGTSWPFLIDEGTAMAFARTYALGLYHQRCGTALDLPFTRFTHGPCHTAFAQVPNRTLANAQKLLADATADFASEPRHTAPRIKDFESSLYPYLNPGPIDVSGGHHDAGDYSKYTINSAHLIHTLVFAVDAFPGVAEMDNLGLPESGDGISDLLQEAKWEADFLAQLQDADGGFYYLVYPRNRAYESDVLPDHGDPQIVWPKNTAATAAAVAALTQCASSPQFKKHYPEVANAYLEKAMKGWAFLTNAIAKYGKDGSYQKLLSYGNEFMHDDELAWAACELFVATGQDTYLNQLRQWFDPSNQSTWRWSWWRMFEGYGNAIRSYAFAVQTGRRSSQEMDQIFMSKCEGQILAAARDVLNRSRQNAYGTSFPLETKRVRTAGWYFSTDQAFDLAVATLLRPDQEMLEAFLFNLNYEAGCNPVNVSYLTGLGWKRQREIVHQYAQNDRRVLPPSGLPLGNIQDQFPFLALYRGDLGKLTYPPDGATYAPYPYYERWADSFNVTTEFTVVNLARSTASLALLAGQTSLKTQLWISAPARITGLPLEIGTNVPVQASLEVIGLNLAQARVVWEARDQEPRYGFSYSFAPPRQGLQWVEVEAQWPDGRRVFAVTNFWATNNLPTVSVVATDSEAAEAAGDPGVFTFSRRGNTESNLTVHYLLSGTASKWTDYRDDKGQALDFVVIPAGATNATMVFIPVDDALYEGRETIELKLLGDSRYNVGLPNQAVINITDDDPRPEPPSIAVQPPNQEEAAGANVVFRVTVSGSPPLNYQWRWNNVPIPGASAESLALTNVQSAQAGSYTVVVTNLAGSITSAAGVLTIKTNGVPGKKAPSISPIPNQKTSLNTPTQIITVFVQDEDTAPEQLILTGSSSNPELVPDGNIVFNGLGTKRNLIVVPAENQIGTAAITISVADDWGLSGATTFAVQVGSQSLDPPVLWIEVSGGELLLSWPAAAVNYLLEVASSCTPPGDWLPLAQSSNLVGNQFLIAITPTEAAQFFRLRRSDDN